MGANYEQLGCEERTMIQLRLEQGCTLRAIACSAGRAPSTVSRELKRNGWINPAEQPRKRGHPALADGYCASLAHQCTDRIGASSPKAVALCP